MYESYFKEAMSTKDALEVFGVEGFKDQEELKTLYKTLSRLNHPDLGGDVEKMKQINQAYDVLKSVRGGVTRPETWDERQVRMKKEQEKNYERFLQAKELFLKSFNEKELIKYLSNFTSDPLSIRMKDNGNNVKNSLYSSSYYDFIIEVHNEDNTTVFYINYTIRPNYNWGNGLGSNDLDARDITYSVSAETNIYFNKRKHKIQKRDYTGNVGFKAVDDFKTILPSAKLKKIFTGTKKKVFKRSDMLLGLKRELPGTLRFESKDFWIHPFGEEGKFQIAGSRATMFGSASYSMGTIFYLNPKFTRGILDSKWFPETEETMDSIIKWVKTSVDEVKRKKLDTLTDGKSVMEIFKNNYEKFLKKID